jgi:hypothetical protein
VDEKNLCAIHRRFIKINNAISQELQKNTFEDIE